MSAKTEAQEAEIVARIRAALAYRDLTPTALCEILQISPGKARRLYHGRKGYTVPEVFILAAYFGISPTAWFAPVPWIELHDPDAEDRAFTARESGQ